MKMRVRKKINWMKRMVAAGMAVCMVLTTPASALAGTQAEEGTETQTISEEALDKIFEKFYREDAARSSATGGAGLGLAIAREIVELHGGTIRAESQDEKTRFIVMLPKEKGNKENEIYTHRRRTSWGMSERWKGLHRK